MAEFIERGNLTSLGAVMQSLHTDLLASGFAAVLPMDSTPLSLTEGAGLFVVESAAVMNPLHSAGQKYRIRMEVKTSGVGDAAAQYMTVVIAGESHITSAGKVFPYPEMEPGVSGGAKIVSTKIMGHLGSAMVPVATVQKASGKGCVFIARGQGEYVQNGGEPAKAYAGNTGVNYGYVLSVSDHGVSFFVWENTTEQTPIFSMFSVQSPVNKDTGAALVDLKSPIFCVYNCDNSGYQKYIVNESDVATPTKPVSAGDDTTDSAAILNEETQVGVKLGNKYLINFPNRVNTERFAYSEELDMIAYTSATVVGEDTILPITMYSEGTPRKYRAMKANKGNNNGMRILVLCEGAGVTYTGDSEVGTE